MNVLMLLLIYQEVAMGPDHGHGFLLHILLTPSQVTKNGSTVSLKYYGKLFQFVKHLHCSTTVKPLTVDMCTSEIRTHYILNITLGYNC